MASGAFRVRLESAWIEIRENLGRSSLQALGVMLGVAAVLGGFSISDSMRKRSEALYIKMGGLDKLNISPNQVASDGTPTANQTANLGLRRADQEEGLALKAEEIHGVGIQRNLRARLRSAYADQERQVTGVGGDHLAIEGFELQSGRPLSPEDQAGAAPVAVIGSEVAKTFFPDGHALGATMRVGEIPVTVVGVLKERVFRFRNVPGQGNIFWRRNRIVAVPATLVQRRIQGDSHARVDRVTFRMPKVDGMQAFSTELRSLLKANHRLQDDFRMDDLAARERKRRNNGDAYDIIFMLSGILSLIGGGIVNVNIQLASLKERVREVGVRMAIGASGREVFKEFMTEAILLTVLGSLVGLVMGIGFSWAITSAIGVPLGMELSSFLWAYGLALVFGIVFALYPAWKASKLSPMEALRYE